MKNFTQQITDQAFEKLLEAWKAEDFDSCKPLLNFICETIPPHELENLLLKNIQAAMGVYELFVKTGFDNALEETPTRAFYLRLIIYIIKNKTPELSQAFKETFNHFFPDIKPIGFKKNGNWFYSLDALAESFGVSMEELISQAQKISDVDIFEIQNPPEGTTLH